MKNKIIGEALPIEAWCKTISLCKSCHNVTHTIDGKCGKCGKEKVNER
jgi:hypothetical protein